MSLYKFISSMDQACLLLLIVSVSIVLAQSPGLGPLHSHDIVDFHNQLRRSVQPTARNMEKMEWNTQLAVSAHKHAKSCNLAPKAVAATISFPSVGQNLHFSTIAPQATVNYSQLILDWYEEEADYDYTSNSCRDVCTNYGQIVWAKTSYVGCGVSFCPPITFFVCHYSPGGNINLRRPYLSGPSCSSCPHEKPVCVHGALCHKDGVPDTVAVSHFMVLIPSGHMLCFSLSGEQGHNLNLISTDGFEMNALFAQQVNRTWLGLIGIAATSHTVVLNSTSGKITINNKMDIDFSLVKKITATDGTLVLTTDFDSDSKPSMEVEIDASDLDLRFSVILHGTEHMDVFWQSVGQPRNKIHGLLGQFFRPDVSLDEDNKLLILPGRSPLPIKERSTFNFMHNEISSGQKCWTSVKLSRQLIEGSFRDYHVDGILSTGFKFGTGNHSAV